jgi:hypothetical protein
MKDKFSGKAELQSTALNDIGSCVDKIFSNSSCEESWTNLQLSIENATTFGVSTESMLSVILNTMPREVCERIVKRLVAEFNLTETDVDGLMAPED